MNLENIIHNLIRFLLNHNGQFRSSYYLFSFQKMFKLVLIICFISFKPCYGDRFNDLRHFGENIRNLSLELLYYTEPVAESHVVMAPFSVWNLFSLVAFKTSSDSWRQIYSIVGIPRRIEQHFNSLFMYVTNLLKRESIGRIYKSKQVVFYDANLDLSRYFRKSILNSGTILKRLNFDDNVSAAKIANDYIQINSEFMPKQIVFDKSDFVDCSMIVSGVTEFSGAWSLPFNESDTVLENGYSGSVYMMHQRAKVRYSDINLLDASALELPYGEDKEYSMVIIRPHENVKIKDVLRNFSKIKFFDVIRQLYSEGLKNLHVKLPKVSIQSLLILNNPLMSMEAIDIFSNDYANYDDFSTESLYVSAMEHRAEIMIGEAGTVAKSYTPGNLAKGTEQPEFGQAPPFLFFIVHGPSMSIIYSGKYGK